MYLQEIGRSCASVSAILRTAETIKTRSRTLIGSARNPVQTGIKLGIRRLALRTWPTPPLQPSAFPCLGVASRLSPLFPIRMDNEKVTQQPNGHHSVGYATKFDQEAEKLHGKAAKHGKGKKDDGKPAGGFDNTSVPRAPPGFNVKFIFHRALKLPMADINTLSSDPYVLATLNTDLPTRHKHDPPMRFRTPTIRRTCDPEWNSEWVVANVPASGFALKARLYDEDPADHDDRLGNVHVRVNSLGQDFQGIHEQHYKIKKRMGSKRAYLIRGCAAMFSKGLHMSGELVISVEVLGKTDTDNGGRMWTIAPCNWTQHISPMVGRLAGTKEPGKDGGAEKYGYAAKNVQCSKDD